MCQKAEGQVSVLEQMHSVMKPLPLWTSIVPGKVGEVGDIAMYRLSGERSMCTKLTHKPFRSMRIEIYS